MFKKFKVGNRSIENYSNPFIIAEAGVNHNGKIQLAKKLVDAAVFAGADAVKFQTFNTEDIVTQKSPKSAYHKITGGSDKKQSWFSLLKSQELTIEEHFELFNYCNRKKIIFLSTPYDFKSVDLLNKIGIKAFKIASTDNNNYPLLKYIASKKKPIILSTGMSNLSEIIETVRVLKNYNQKKISILQCTSSYPCNIKDLNLLVIQTFIKTFDCPIGFSDHSNELMPAIISTSLGSSIYEKHLTLDKKMKGPDHRASSTPKELKEIIKKIRSSFIMLGSNEKKVLKCEKENRKKLKKSLVANRFIKQGTKLNKKLFGIKRPANGLDPSFYEKINKFKSLKDIKKDTIITIKMIKKNV